MSEPSKQPWPQAGRVVVANAGAGSTETDAVHAAVARLATDAPVELHWTEDPEDFVDVVGKLDDSRQLVVAGGDGSIHLALETVTDLGRADRAVGIIPLGTGNDFARNHGIPLDPVEAADVVVGGNAGCVAAMRVETTDAGPTMVANNIHLGLGVRAAQHADGLKSKLGRFAYPVATARQGMSSRTIDLTVDLDGARAHDGPLLALLMLLGPSMGGGVEVVPPERHGIEVVLVEPAGPVARLALVRAALRSRIHDASRAERVDATCVVVDRPGGVDANLDGELVHLETPLTLTLLPGAWKVSVPG